MIKRTVHWALDRRGWQQGTLVAIAIDYEEGQVGIVITQDACFIRVPLGNLRDGVVPEGRRDA